MNEFPEAAMNPYLLIESRIEKLVAPSLYDRSGSWPGLAHAKPEIVMASVC